MDQGSSHLNPSSLIDLKAELHKKYENFRKAKLEHAEKPQHTALKCKGDHSIEKKEKPVRVRQNSKDVEEENALEKSRLALEAKAKLYEKIVTNKILIGDEQNESYLVDFQKKVLDEPSTTSSKYSDISLSSTLGEQPKVLGKPSEKSKNFKYDSSFTNQDAVLENLEHPGMNPDEPVHYQNVRFNEVRDHGTGYFAFSTDEAKRKEQMDELNSLRQETENQISSKQRLLKKRKAMIQNRLAKICERKNIDPSALEAFKTEEEPQEETSEIQPDAASDATEESPAKEPKIRPWDIGKNKGLLQDFIPEKRQKKTQKDWVDEKREERPSEFAPPSYYDC